MWRPEGAPSVCCVAGEAGLSASLTSTHNPHAQLIHPIKVTRRLASTARALPVLETAGAEGPLSLVISCCTRLQVLKLALLRLPPSLDMLWPLLTCRKPGSRALSPWDHPSQPSRDYAITSRKAAHCYAAQGFQIPAHPPDVL